MLKIRAEFFSLGAVRRKIRGVSTGRLTMKRAFMLWSAVIAGAATGIALARAAATTPSTAPAGPAVTLTGGHDTDPRDKGRPVVLVAAGLGVTPEVFRDAFSRVTPAPAGREPQ